MASEAKAADSSTDKVKGSWTSSISKKGEYVRKASVFRNFISADGDFPPAKGRYTLYVSYACPWAHRTLIVRALKGLEDVIDVVVVDWLLKPGGWRFNPERPGATPDFVNEKEYLKQVYAMANPDYEGNITVPVLWDKERKTIVNNESSEIIRMLNSEFNEFSATPEQAAVDLYPKDLRESIESFNEWIYPKINNGVYRSGFAQSQEAYSTAVTSLFEAMDRVEEALSKNRFLTGSVLTEADVRLFTTLVRFDPVYVTHFKCNLHRVEDYPNMLGFVRELYQMPGVADTVNMEHIKNHYFQSHTHINPTAIVPIANGPDLTVPHGRDSM